MKRIEKLENRNAKKFEMCFFSTLESNKTMHNSPRDSVRVGGQEHSELSLQDFDLHTPIRVCPGRWPICGKFQAW